MNLDLIKNCLEKANVQFEKGLSDSEVERIESKYAFRFPPDLKEFLQFSLPISKGWVHWRNDSETEINSKLNWAYDGICFDIEYNSFWKDDWGEKPNILADAFEVAKQKVQNAPILIPIYSHRFIPERPNLEGNPIFSVYQTDIIIYGNDLQTYFQNEFSYYFEWEKKSIKENPRVVEFWSDFVD